MFTPFFLGGADRPQLATRLLRVANQRLKVSRTISKKTPTFY